MRHDQGGLRKKASRSSPLISLANRVGARGQGILLGNGDAALVPAKTARRRRGVAQDLRAASLLATMRRVSSGGHGVGPKRITLSPRSGNLPSESARSIVVGGLHAGEHDAACGTPSRIAQAVCAYWLTCSEGSTARARPEPRRLRDDERDPMRRYLCSPTGHAARPPRVPTRTRSVLPRGLRVRVPLRELPRVEHVRHPPPAARPPATPTARPRRSRARRPPDRRARPRARCAAGVSPRGHRRLAPHRERGGRWRERRTGA